MLTLTTSAVNGTGVAFYIDYTHAVPAGSNFLHIFASPNLSPGISYVNSTLRDIGFIALNASPASQSIATLWETRFGSVARIAGKKIFVLVSVIDQTTGIQSPGIFADCILK